MPTQPTRGGGLLSTSMADPNHFFDCLHFEDNMSDEVITTISDTPIWSRFGLSYASYAVFPRIALCSMPIEWQDKFLALLDEMIEQLPEGTMDGDYLVKLRENGKFVKDPLSDYRHHPRLPLKG